MATLGNIRWGLQYTTTYNEVASTKTINGLNLNEDGTAEAEQENATKANLLATRLASLSLATLTNTNLVETRPVTD